MDLLFRICERRFPAGCGNHPGSDQKESRPKEPVGVAELPGQNRHAHQRELLGTTVEEVDISINAILKVADEVIVRLNA